MIEELITEAEQRFRERIGLPVRIKLEYALTISIGELKNMVCSEFGVTWEVITNGTRKYESMVPREIFVYLCATYLQISDKDIAMLVGNDRTTCITNRYKVKCMIETNDLLYLTPLMSILEKLRDYESSKN